VNASVPPAAFLNFPTAVQLPAVAHDTELNRAEAADVMLGTPESNTAGVAWFHTPVADVGVLNPNMANATKPAIATIPPRTTSRFTRTINS
jgi:hypothetical protein